MSTQDIRWKQRFDNYAKAFAKLEEAVQKIQTEFPIDKEGTINADHFFRRHH